MIRTIKLFKITMRGQEKEIILKASSEEQAAKWVEKMEKMIKKSKGRKKELTMLQPKFWKEEYLGKDLAPKTPRISDL